MTDSITIERIKLLHPKLRNEVTDLYLNKIIPALKGTATFRIAYTLRTFAEQAELYAQGRTKLFDAQGNRLGQITKANAGQSFHNYGLALDFVLITSIAGKSGASWDTAKDFDGDGIADWMEVVNIFKNAGWTWGGDFKSFKDKPHVEKTFGLTWQQCFNLHGAGKVDSNGYIII